MTDRDKIRLSILPTGAMHADLVWLLIDAHRMGTAENPTPARDWVEVPTHVVYIEHPDGTKLMWDTGVPRDWDTRWATPGFNKWFPVDTVTPDMWLDSQLRQLNIEAADIDYLMISHLHMDHAANAQLWAGTDTTIIVDEREKAGALSFDGYHLGAHIRSDYEDLTFTTINQDTEIAPGVTLLRTPGHTWGTLALQVDLADQGTMIFASDALYRSESYGPPATAAGIVYDTVAWFKSVEKIRSLAEKTNATVVFGHDPHQIRQLVTGVGNYYT